MRRPARSGKWLALGALVAAIAVAVGGLGAAPSTGAAKVLSGGPGVPVQWSQPVRLSVAAQSGKVRRESQVPTQPGPPPRTGPASPYQPLIQIPLVDVNFGPNYRANNDPQAPNLAQQEPSISVNPTNPLNVVADAKDERAGVNTKQDWIYTSTDGGVTWLNQIFPLSPSSPFSSDPVVNFTDDGICYVTALPYGGGVNDGVQIATSTDGGITFSPGVHLPGSNGGSDKEWTWVDNNPASPNYHRVYNAWMDFGQGSIISLNYSTDRGATFSSKVTVGTAYQFPMPISLPNGDVLVTYVTAPSGSIAHRRSTNGGASFTSAQMISSLTDPNCPPDNSGCGIWRLNPIPADAVDRTNGDIVTVWADGRTGTAIIYYTRSTDGGATWSAAAQLAPSGVGGTYQVEPWVVADENGLMHAIWYDDRESPNTSIFHIYYSQSTDDGATWSQAERISTASSDLRIGIPSTYGGAAGDYINVDAQHGNVYAAWTDTRAGNGEDIYVVRGTYGAVGTPTDTPVTTATPSPTQTSVPPTGTAVPPTGTGVPPSETPVTATGTAIEPTRTPIPAPTICPFNFTDVPVDSPFFGYIRCLVCNGIVTGYSDNTFRPNNNITRGQIAKVVAGAAGYSDDVGGRQTYADVPPSNTFYVWIERLAIHQVMGGYPCGGHGEPCDERSRPYFRWANNATRGQITKIVSNAAGYTETPTSQTFEDVPPTDPFYTWIERLAMHNVIGGYRCGELPAGPCVPPDNRAYFLPYNNVTRGQASKIVSNTFFVGCYIPPSR